MKQGCFEKRVLDRNLFFIGRGASSGFVCCKCPLMTQPSAARAQQKMAVIRYP
jgi:hypothetical protein